MLILLSLILVSITQCRSEIMYTNDLNFRVAAGGRTCFFEKGKAGNMMEVYYQVTDGQHGELDISLDVIDPKGTKIVTDYKKPENAIIKELVLDGDYAFCLDNTYSSFNSKLVFVYVIMESKDSTEEEAVVTLVDDAGNEVKQIEVLNWQGTDENGEPYYVEVAEMADSLSRTLKHVVKARHMLDLYGASKSRDSYLAFEETFVVDLWSSVQITFMLIVGMIQVCMIKKLFKSPSH